MTPFRPVLPLLVGLLPFEFGAPESVAEPRNEHLQATFMATTAEAACVAWAIDHGPLRLLCDTATTTINDDADSAILPNDYIIGHALVSEPDISSLGDSGNRTDTLGGPADLRRRRARPAQNRRSVPLACRSPGREFAPSGNNSR